MTDQVNSALRRVVAEIQEGLRHGHFEYGLTCEVIGQDRRRLVLRAGKTYKFVLPAGECVSAHPVCGDPGNQGTL